MKRSDQYRIDVAEAGASDYKNRPRKPEDADRHDELYSRVMKGPDVKGQPIPPDALQPETESERAGETQREQHVRGRKAGQLERPDDTEAAEEAQESPPTEGPDEDRF